MTDPFSPESGIDEHFLDFVDHAQVMKQELTMRTDIPDDITGEIFSYQVNIILTGNVLTIILIEQFEIETDLFEIADKIVDAFNILRNGRANGNLHGLKLRNYQG